MTNIGHYRRQRIELLWLAFALRLLTSYFGPSKLFAKGVDRERNCINMSLFEVVFYEKFATNWVILFYISAWQMPRDGMVRIENRKLYSNLMKI